MRWCRPMISYLIETIILCGSLKYKLITSKKFFVPPEKFLKTYLHISNLKQILNRIIIPVCSCNYYKHVYRLQIGTLANCLAVRHVQFE